MKKKIIIISVIILILIIGGFFFFRKSNGEKGYRTEALSRGTIKATVTATGTVNAVTTVLVGTQVSGTIKKLLVDYNSPVKKDQLLAQIDPELFQAQVDQARANLQLAVANVAKAEVALTDTRRTYERNKTLFARNFIARSDLDNAETAFHSADAQIKAAKAQVAQAQAALRVAETNLHHTNILSPVNGTVISRSIDVGQTVAASFQTPTLFNIAADLTKMQIDTSVDEADIGRVQAGQKVTFTVDAYPEISFQGNVAVVRNAPITVQNVVTYNSVITVDNSDLKLKPGMTANVSIETATRTNALRAPNAALRFKPSLPAEKVSGNPALKGEKAARGPGIWILENKKPKHVKISTGISDGKYTEVIAGEISEGQQVIVDTQSAVKKNEQAAGAGAPRFIR